MPDVKLILRTVGAELKATLRGVGEAYLSLGRQFTIEQPTPMVVLRHIPKWFLILLAFGFLFGHWLLSPWAWVRVFGGDPQAVPWLFSGIPLMIGGVLLLVLLIAMYVGFAKQALRQGREARPILRGALLAPAPFYLAALTAIVWGINEGIFNGPRGNDAWMVALNYSIPDPPKYAVGGIATGASTLLLDPSDQVLWHPLAYWAYIIKLTTTVSLVSVFDTFFFGGGAQPPWLARIYSWGYTCDLAEVIIGAINATVFIGIIGDIALSVQRKIAIGDPRVDVDLSEDHGLALLTGLGTLCSLDQVDEVLASWEAMGAIRTQALTLLRERLSHEEPQARATAAIVLGELGDRAALAPLRSLLADPAARVRSAALVALARLDPASIARDLTQALARSKTDPVLATTAEQLAPELTRDQPESPATQATRTALRAALIDCLGVEDLDVQRTAAALLSTFDARRTTDALIRRLPRPKYDDIWRVGALLALGRLGRPRAEQALVPYVRSKSLPLRLAAIEALGSVSGTRGLKALLGGLRDDRAVVRRTTTLALGRRGEPKALAPLIARLDDGVVRPLTIAALGAIARHAAEAAGTKAAQPTATGSRVFDALRPLTTRALSREARDALSDALAETLDPRAVALLSASLPDANAALALGRLGDPEAVPALLAATRRARREKLAPEQRTAPIAALGALGEPAVEALIALYKARRIDRDMVALALARTEAESGLDFLIARYNPDDPERVRILAPALAATHKARARQVLVDTLNDNPTAARYAALALGDMQDPAALDPLTAALSTWDDQVKAAILSALAKFNPETLTDSVVETIKSQVDKFAEGAQGFFKAVGRFATFGLLGDDDDDKAPPGDERTTGLPSATPSRPATDAGARVRSAPRPR